MTTKLVGPGIGLLLLTLLPSAALAQTDEARLRERAVADTVHKFDADLASKGNGSYEAWVAKLAPLRELWANKILQRDQMVFDNFVSPDGYVSQGFRSILGDITVRLDGSQPLYQIVRLNKQLKEKGIDLIFGIVPTSMEVFPEKFVDRSDLIPADGIVAPYRRKFLHLLAESGVEVVDLVEVLRANKGRPDADQLVLHGDYHWSNLGLTLSAEAIAERLKRYDFVQKSQSEAAKYSAKEVVVKGLGQSIKLWPVNMPNGVPWEPAEKSPLLVIGDSNMQVYGTHNPVRDWLPNSPDHADFGAQISRYTGVQASLLSIQAFTPDMLNREPATTWDGRRVVIWVADGCHVLAAAPWGDVRLKDRNRPEPSQTHLTAPSADTVLGASGKSVVTFTWSAVAGASDYWIDIGTEPGGNISAGFTGGALSKTIDLRPYLNGKPIYIQLFSRFDNTLVRPPASYTFRTQSPQR